MDPKVKRFLNSLPPEKRRLAEAIKWGNLTFVYRGKNLVFIYTYQQKPYLSFGFRQGIMLDDPRN